MQTIPQILAKELDKPQQAVENVIALLDQGNTIPFIARYRNCLLYTSPSPRDRG